MKEYKLNVFVPIVKENNGYVFGVGGYFSLEGGNVINLSSTEEQLLNRLIKGEKFSLDQLSSTLSKNVFEYFTKNNIVIDYSQDAESIYSRSKAYYFLNNFGDLQSKISRKKVLILGCGGIGTHVAWNLTVLGVNEISLVDFDCVEESNLNRQLLYDNEDIGRLKAEALKNKLCKINPGVKINAINKQISSESELDNLCSELKYDLIIKALDSPSEFPVWLDNVCKRRNIIYISGITVGAYSMIGPTFIPNTSCGFSEFFNYERVFKRVCGLTQSLGVIFYHISSEISSEAFKVLAGVGKLNYINSIYVENFIDNTKILLTPKKIEREVYENKKNDRILTSIIIILSMVLLSVLTNLRFITILCSVYSLLSSMFIYKSREKVLKGTFVNVTVFIFLNIIVAFFTNLLHRNMNFAEYIALITSAFVLLSVSSVISCLIANIMYFGKKKLEKLLQRR